ncbi:hypothetical protein [Brevibacillus borstelensis]|uniref:hypothetical protein n=1 Tax=Brevibacillus borstelensis TaxID=45462 RepID=UPI003CC912D5
MAQAGTNEAFLNEQKINSARKLRRHERSTGLLAAEETALGAFLLFVIGAAVIGMPVSVRMTVAVSVVVIAAAVLLVFVRMRLRMFPDKAAQQFF